MIFRVLPDPGFNTQPPEGGWDIAIIVHSNRVSFNTQPPEGGWAEFKVFGASYGVVSTHSRPKAAGHQTRTARRLDEFQHTAARRRLERQTVCR